MPTILKIFVAEHCPTCRAAFELAAQVQQTFPETRVQLIDVEKSPADVPDSVFATPTFMLNNRIISLGNPSLPEITAQLQALPREKISQE